LKGNLDVQNIQIIVIIIAIITVRGTETLHLLAEVETEVSSAHTWQVRVV
jgi:hypothetical protein